MELPIKQLNKLLGQANTILITGPKDPNLDVLGSAMAWHVFLTGQKKKVDIVFDGKVPNYKFLPKDITIDNSLGNLSKFKIVLDVAETKVKQLSYDMKGDQLVIDIVPEDGTFSAEDVKTDRGDYKYDLVLVLGADSLDSLGEIFSENRYFFHSTPIINIDTSVLNENYGQLNIVEAKSTSLAEISYSVFDKNINKKMSTCLLAGMIMSTNSFQSPKVNPETLDIASQLIIKGAQRAEIVDALYRTRDIGTLKNWGKVLSRLNKKGGVISSFLHHDEADYLPESFQDMVKDLILSTPGAQAAVIFYQAELHQTEAWVYTISNINATELVKDIKGQGTRRLAKVSIDKDLESSKEYLIAKLTKQLDIINSA